MTSKFSSRFRRPADKAVAGSPPPVAESEKPSVAEAAAAKAEPKTEGVETAKTEIAKSESVRSESPAQPVAAREAEPVARVAVPPARLIEVERTKPAAAAEPVKAKVSPSRVQAYRVPAAAAAALLIALGTGYGVGLAGKDEQIAVKSAQMLESTSHDLREANSQIGQLNAELEIIKAAFADLRGEREKAGKDLLVKQAQLSERFEKAGQDSASRIGKLTEQLDRLEKAQREAQRLAALEKADKPQDRQPEKVAAAPLPPPKPALDVTHTGSLGDARSAEKPDPRKTPLEGYSVRDYDQGYALIETRSGRYYDVAVGYNLPGIGKVEAIERRGRQWVVVTAKGYIGER